MDITNKICIFAPTSQSGGIGRHARFAIWYPSKDVRVRVPSLNIRINYIYIERGLLKVLFLVMRLSEKVPLKDQRKGEVTIKQLPAASLPLPKFHSSNA